MFGFQVYNCVYENGTLIRIAETFARCQGVTCTFVTGITIVPNMENCNMVIEPFFST